jgi:hypothetical protein
MAQHPADLAMARGVKVIATPAVITKEVEKATKAAEKAVKDAQKAAEKAAKEAMAAVEAAIETKDAE